MLSNNNGAPELSILNLRLDVRQILMTYSRYFPNAIYDFKTKSDCHRERIIAFFYTGVRIQEIYLDFQFRKCLSERLINLLLFYIISPLFHLITIPKL